MDPEEEGTGSVTEETINLIRVADMIGSTLEEVCALPELEKNELFGILIITDKHRQEDLGNRVHGENQDANITEETMNLIRVADMIGSTLEEVRNLPELEKNELLSLLPVVDEHKQEDLLNRVLGENQDDNIILKVVEKRENEEEGTESVTEETTNSIRVADMIGSTLEEVCHFSVLEKNELLGLPIITDEHKQEDLGNGVLSENQDDTIILKVDEKRKDEARAKVVAELRRDVEMVKLQLTDIVGDCQASNDQTNKSVPSDEEIFVYLEAHMKEEQRIQIVVDEFRGGNISESQGQTVSHGHQSSQSSRPTLDVAEQMIQSVHEDDNRTDEIPKLITSKGSITHAPPNQPSNVDGPSSSWPYIDEQSKPSYAGPSTDTPVKRPSMPSEKEQPSGSFDGPIIPAPSQIEKSDGSAEGASGLAPQDVGVGDVDPEAMWQTDKEACLIDIFPEYSPEWIHKQMQAFKMSWGTDDGKFNENVEKIMEGVGDVDPEALWRRDKEACLIEMFPEYSTEWLLKQIQGLEMSWGTDDDKFNEHVEQIMELDKINIPTRKEGVDKINIPTRKEWEKQAKDREELDKCSGNMTVNDMLELYGGDPAKHFTDTNRKDVIDNSLYREHSRIGLLDAFRCTSETIIDRELTRAHYSFSLAHKALQEMPADQQTERPNSDVIYPANPSIEFVKEKKFVELRESIDIEKVNRGAAKRKALEAARLFNALLECECCYNECLDQEMVPCNAGHLYCKECVGESVNVAMGEGKTIILCLGQCEEEINTRELQFALPPNVFSKLLSERQADEVGAAGIENLVTCPFCPYSTIMENEEDKVLVCRNLDCGRDSCRLCEEPSHIPFRCEEVKSKDATKRKDGIRKRVEEALSDAIIRKCANPKCPASFMKTEGCNKMVCQKCGAEQCYLCKKIVPGYEHFYGQGGEPDNTRVCPLWSDNDELHASEVSTAAQKEAEELKKDGVELEYNPKEGITLLETNTY